MFHERGSFLPPIGIAFPSGRRLLGDGGGTCVGFLGQFAQQRLLRGFPRRARRASTTTQANTQLSRQTISTSMNKAAPSSAGDKCDWPMPKLPWPTARNADGDCMVGVPGEAAGWGAQLGSSTRRIGTISECTKPKRVKNAWEPVLSRSVNNVIRTNPRRRAKSIT
jgi:hypothetical protein